MVCCFLVTAYNLYNYHIYSIERDSGSKITDRRRFLRKECDVYCKITRKKGIKSVIYTIQTIFFLSQRKKAGVTLELSF